MAFGFGFGFPSVRAINGLTPPMPGFPFVVLDSDGNSFVVQNIVLNAAGSSYAVSATVLDSDGNAFNPI